MMNRDTQETLNDRIYDLEQDLRTVEDENRRMNELADGIFVNVYEVDRNYGGPEEGGWWFDSGTVVNTFQMVSRNQANALAELLRNVFSDAGNRYSMAQREADYRVVVEGEAGADWPTERPYYC